MKSNKITLTTLSLFSSLLALSFLSFSAGAATAQTTEFGGHDARFKGDGDREPPLCNVEAPSNANEPFFIKWNCTDNESGPDELRSEVWMLRNGAQIPLKVADFLGFPASVRIEKAHLIDQSKLLTEEDKIATEEKDFQSFLPIGIRMLVRDRSGNASLSPVLIVEPGSSIISRCSVNIRTEQQLASLQTSGIPSLEARSVNIPVQTLSSNLGSRTVNSKESFGFNPCQIDFLCNSEDMYTLNLVTNNQAGGTLSLLSKSNSLSSIPMNNSLRVSDSPDSISLRGETTIDGINSEVFLTCD